MEKNFFDQFDSTDSNSSGSSSDNFFDQFDAPTPKKKKDEDRGAFDVVKDLGVSLYEGAKGTGRMLGAAGNTVSGDLADVEDYADRQSKAAADKPQALQNLNADLESRRQKLGEDAGLLDSIGAVGGALANNPEGAAQFVVEQAPNSAVSLGSGVAGGKAGAAAGGSIGAFFGPAGAAVGAAVGGIGGFLGGMFLGNAALETGGKAIEKAEGGFTEAERGEAIKEGAVKGGVITAVDAATLGAGGLVAKGFAKEAIEAGARAEAKVLSRAGVDVASREAVESALSDAALRTAAEEAGKKAAQAATTLKNRLAAGGTGLTMETAGEGVGEYLGELAATGEADVYDAVIESFAGLSQSAVETAYNLKNAQGNDLDSRGIARAGQNLEPDQEGEGGTAIAEGSTANAVTFKPDPATPDTSGSENVASATDDEAVRALKTPVQLTALDRAQELDSEIGRLTERLTELSPQNGYGEAFDTERNEIATRAQELAMERDEIAKTWPKAVPGIETEFSTESGAKIQGQYAIMDAADLVTSNDENLKANPLYPKELQPRDRSRQASEIQISGIVGKLDPARLGVSADAATGAPIVGADGLVESGNARTIALKRVYQANGQKAEDYKSFLRANAQQFGLTPEQIDQVQKPVLVRVRSTPVNRAEFARQANASTVQRMSPSEAALSDASRLTSLEGLNPDENGDFDSSIDFIRQFMATLPITEQSDMLESDGRLSTTGYRRIQNAVLAKAYGDSPTLRRMTESRDDNLRNITKALTFAAPTIAAARERIASGSMYDADIASDLIQAVEGLSSIKQRGWTVDQELAQTDLTGPKYSEESAELLNFLDQNIRSPRRIAEFMQRYYEALEAAGDPNQGTIFDEPVAPTRQGLINQARGQNVPTTANTERGLDSEAAQAAQESGRQPEDAPGNQGRNQGDEGPSTGTGTRSEEGSREDANWVNYPEDSGTLGIPRAQMPQIKSEARGALVQFLKARGIDSESKSVPASQLKPTQAEYSADKVKRFIESGPVDGSRSVLISSDNHVLDGHHQWMTFQAMDKDVPVIQLNAPIRELLEQVYEFPSAKRSEGAPAESGTETTAASNSPFPTISETKAPSIGPMGSAKITPIAPGKPLFRQTNLEGLDDVARYDNQAEIINLFVTDNVDLALGQAGNKGVLIEFRPDSLSGSENVKPGTGDDTGREYKTNVAAPKAIAAVTMKAVDVPRLRGLTRNLLKRDFTKSVLGNSFVQYKRNGVESSGETGSIADKPVKKSVVNKSGNNKSQSVEAGNKVADKAPVESDTALSRASASAIESAAFKKWFGDWTIASKGRMPRAASSLEEAKNVAAAFMGKPIVNSATKLVGMVSGNNLRKMASQKAGDKSTSMLDHALAIANLDKLFENAVLDHSHPDNKGEPTIRAIHRYIAPMFGLDGGLRAVKLTVKETTGPNEPNPIYTVEAIEIKSPPSVLSRANPEKAGIRPQAGINKSVLDMLDEVNRVSKVVDAEGKPLVVYHGTRPGNDIAEFEALNTRDGIYFTPDASYAEGFTNDLRGNTGEAGSIYPVYLSIKNPYVVRTDDIESDEAQNFLYRGLDRAELEKQGYDGAMLYLEGELDQIIAFDSKQVKSAIGNKGTFDPDNADIRLSNSGVGGGVDVAALEKLAASVKKRLPNLPEVVVLGEPYQAPRALREYIVAQGAVLDAEGAYHNGKLYLFASGLSDLARAEFVLAEHEAAHYGLRAVLGDRLKAVMNQIYNNNASVRKAATELQRNGKLTNAQATEEVLVDMPSSELIRLKGWRKLTALIRDWLDSAGFSNLANKLQKWLAAGMDTQQLADLYAADIVRAARDFVAGKSLGRVETRLVRTEAMLSRGDGVPAPSRAPATKALTDRVNDMIADKAVSIAPLEKILKTATRLSGIERLTSKIYDEAANLLQRLPETVKAGVVSDYGVPEAVIDQRVLLQGRQRVQLRKAGNLVDKLATLTREESRVAYEWLNEGDSPRAQQLMDALPADSVKVLKDVQQMIDRLSKEAVALGQLDSEAYERNKFAYLRRSYAKHLTDQTPIEKAKRSRVLSILGDQYKGRGLSDSVPMAKIQNLAPEWWGRKMAKGKADTALKGHKFIRLERRKAAGQGTVPLPGMPGKAEGKLLEVVFWPAEVSIPTKYSDWNQSGTWEVRTVKGADAVMWRDFTKAERETMGEVDEARFAIAKTLHGMIHDVEVGRYLEWLSINYAKKPGEEMQGDIVEASERYRDTFKPTDWVQVPETKVPGTNVLKYGKLAGRYIPGPIWNDLRQVVNGQFRPFGDTYAKILSLWKTSKTALSPAVHMNNIMSNFVMADWHDVTAGHVAKALRIVLAANKGENSGALAMAGKGISKAVGISDREAAKELLNRYSDSGGDVGSWVTNEIATDQLEPLLKSLEVELTVTAGASHQAQTGVFAALQHALMLRFPSAWEAFKPSVPGRVIGNEAKSLISLYQTEDDIFRLAAWLKAKEQGMDDLSAGKASRKSFLDYNINAPWIQAMRNSAWPFISFTYRAVPMMLEVAGKRPHKLLKLMLVAGSLNALGSMLAGDEDDEEERKLLPEEKAGKIWGMVPKLIRMPWDDQFGSPVYLDIRRFIPVGDIFDVGATSSAIPILPGMQPGGPLVLFGEVILNKSMFTGKPITLDTDTKGQKVSKTIDYLYKAFAPNILGLPGTYATTGVVGSLTGRTDPFGREMSTAQAVASSFGVKLGSYPADVLRRNLNAKSQAELMEIQRNISQLKRQRQTGRLDQEEFADKVRVELEKKTKIQRDLAEKLK
ncbi:hypothetical protein [Limnobacter sp.]|uniref:ADP-ribosyltransferase-containing protein n=1 Tax=Limnobacter sp. TaxID=2003368 RepID=UPI00311FE1AB